MSIVRIILLIIGVVLIVAGAMGLLNGGRDVMTFIFNLILLAVGVVLATGRGISL